MTTFLQFQPLYQERVWGGRALENFPGRKLPGAAPIGESWEMADRPEAQSVVAAGPWAGRTLRAVLAAHAAEIMGPAWPAARPFPILVKWLDCRDRLSVQVHPPADLAGKLHGEPKTENWYFARTDPGAAVYAGLKAGVTRAAFAQALAAGTVARCLERTAVRAGDSLLIPGIPDSAKNNGNTHQSTTVYYKVRDGDTLWRIASQFGVPVADLFKDNNLKTDSVIVPGDTIKVVRQGNR
jgi:mannose-6-phosphate isomerase